jgi:N-acyl amino acid synthase FeeM
MQLIDVPLEQLAGLCHRFNPTPHFEALFHARTASNARGAPSEASRPAKHNSVAREVNATIASSQEELRAVGDLVARRYAWRGYMVDTRALICPAPGETTKSAITLIASDATGEAVGTLTLGFDGPAGLLVDAVYGTELEAARDSGRRVCELTRLAVDRRAESKAVLAALFGLAFLLGRVLHRVTDVFIEVNPRHVAFYERALGFVVAAGEQICERVKAPSVLLRLDTEQLEERLKGFAFGGSDGCLAAI